ncbi:MAG: DUF4147 domain-containing protein [Candidatus Heimdallarchaeota archaeon]|nr:DUF4147 domain-containing protein [Candidatus Heimdallarchaeota archaeon]
MDGLLQNKPIIKNYSELIRQDRDPLTKQGRKIVLDILSEGIKAASPKKAMIRAVKYEKRKLQILNQWERELSEETKVIVVGAGKATGNMAIALEDILGEKIDEGLINLSKESLSVKKELERIQVNPAGHPRPDHGSITGARRILKLINGLSEQDIVICLISGGGSALLEIPHQSLSLQDVQELFEQLTAVGATIHELNTIRKHLSQIKGGRLAQLAQPATVISLIISDVVGDELEVIASGPTPPDPSTWKDVQKIIDKYQLWDKVTESIQQTIKKGLKGEVKETPKADQAYFKNVHNFLIATNTTACRVMRDFTEQKSLQPMILSTKITGEARQIGRQLAQQINQAKPGTVIIAGGETTVTIQGKGKGGRNQEVVLGALEELANEKGVVLAALASDGIDGPTTAAGAIIDGKMKKKIVEQMGLEIKQYLANNDSFHFFQKTKGLIFTGATGTNVMDFIVTLKTHKK